MLRERIAILLLVLPVLAWVVVDGGWLYAVVISVLLAIAAFEYGMLFRRHGYRPSLPLLVGGVLLLGLVRFSAGFSGSPALIAILSMVVMIWHLVDFEKGASTSGTDFAISLAGIIYLGWIGAFLISLRGLADGVWWFLVGLPSVWLADSAAYFVGNWLGRHRLSPRLSPKKSWEGYIAGILAGALAGAGFAALWRVAAGESSSLTWSRGLIVGSVIATFAPLGDLGISMIKREMSVKDSGSILPGHGGALDRMDSWLWAGVLGYYAVSGLAAL
jgi:phosphatidate cytidylyltransferase